MGLATMTLEMRTPEEHRERLHDLVKATRSAIVLSYAPGDPLDGRPMLLVRVDDDTTMYLATALDGSRYNELVNGTRVTVMLQGAGYALFTGKARISRDRALIGALWTDAWKQWSYGPKDARNAVVIVTPLEGSYWEATTRHSYVYQLDDDR
jgi:general stress protein 26